jgi:hypothetical protein
MASSGMECGSALAMGIFLTTATDVDIKALKVRNCATVTVVVPKEKKFQTASG